MGSKFWETRFMSEVRSQKGIFSTHYIYGISTKKYYSSNNYCDLKKLTHFIEDSYNSILMKRILNYSFYCQFKI